MSQTGRKTPPRPSPAALTTPPACFDTAADSVTVKVASLPSDTFAAGPDMLSSDLSLSSVGVVVVPLWSFRVTVAELTLSPTCVVVVPGMMMVSSPSTMVSSVGVIVSVPLPVSAFAGMVIVLSAVFTA